MKKRTTPVLEKVLFAVAFATLLGATASAAQAQALPKGKLPEGNIDLGKVSSNLLEARSLARQGSTARQMQDAMPTLPFRNGLLEIEVRLRTLTPEIVAQVQAIGMQITGVYYQYARIVGLCDPELLDDIAAIPEVRTIHPNYPPLSRKGSVTNQANTSIRADLARATFGVDGSGINVGLLSGSFHDTIGGTVTGMGCKRTLTGSAPQLSGDLPANVTVLDNGPGGETDEGAGIAELVSDLAPGAGIMFHTSQGGEAAFAEGITELRTCGADVMVDDILYFVEPMFQDGIVAQAAQAAVNNSVAYFSAAGNDMTFGVDEMYLDANPTDDNSLTPSGNDFHDFGAGDRFGAITVPPGCGVRLVLQWSEPFDGTLGPGASSDLDLRICSSTNPASCTQGSTSAQGCFFGSGVQQGDPFEIFVFTNTGGSPVTIHTAVEHFCGNKNVRFRIAAFEAGVGCDLGDGYTFEGGIFDKTQIYGHAAAAGVEAVAAVFYREIDADGNLHLPSGQLDVEPFSSLGGNLPFYFDASGNPLPGAPVLRFKPEIAAPDGTNTTFFGNDIIGDPDPFPNFFGTSAAAPHAAAVAALMLDANPTLTPAQIRSTLASTAIDVESLGVDSLSGAGLIDAVAAVTAVVPPSGVDLTGSWQSLTQTCKGAGAQLKCKLKGNFPVRNQGTQKGLASRLRFFLSTDATFDGSDAFLKQAGIPSLKVNKVKKVKLKVSLPVGSSASGQFVIAVVDADDSVAEISEANNRIVFGPLP